MIFHLLSVQNKSVYLYLKSYKKIENLNNVLGVICQ